MANIKVPYLDLRAQYRSIKPEIDQAVARVLDSCQFVLGPEVAEFEKEFASYCGTTECVAVNSGTSALHLALLAAGVGPGDEVITVPFTFVASVSTILYAGAKPVLVDIEPRTFNMNPDALEAAISPRTKAIVPVHLYGHPADMDPILEVAQKNKLIVIEDAAQAHGAKYKGRSSGSIGDIGCFSFYPAKNLGACGEGGAITTSNPEYARKIRMLRDWGQDRKYHHVLHGYNYRMEGFQGADLLLPTEMPGTRHVYHLYTIRADNRDALQAALLNEEIQTGIHYSTPVHLQPAYAELGYGPDSFPESEKAAKEVLSLPIYPELSDSQIKAVAEALTRLAQPA